MIIIIIELTNSKSISTTCIYLGKKEEAANHQIWYFATHIYVVCTKRINQLQTDPIPITNNFVYIMYSYLAFFKTPLTLTQIRYSCRVWVSLEKNNNNLITQQRAKWSKKKINNELMWGLIHFRDVLEKIYLIAKGPTYLL